MSAPAVVEQTVDEFAVGTPSGPAAAHAAAYHGYRRRGVPPALHRGLPSPFLTLIFTVHDPLVIVQHVDATRTPGRYDAVLGGLHTSPALVENGGAQSGIQVQLDPLAARAVLGVPAGELADRDDHADAIMGRRAVETQERIAAATTWHERFAVLDGLLATTRDDVPPPEVVRAWHLLRRTNGRIPVSHLAREVGWSERRLGTHFRTELGLTPKAAARVIRFDRARRDLQAQASRGITHVADVAARHGYYDQSHLVRDFTQFTGLPPTAWLAAERGNVQAGDVAITEDWAS